MQQLQNMDKDFKPVTLRDIAEKTGLSKSTVSRALHDSHLLNEATKEKVRRVASKMGYRPSSAMSAAMQSARTRGRKAYHETIACIMVSGDRYINKDPRRLLTEQLVKGMEDTTEIFGAYLDFFNIRHTSWEKIDRLLTARGIRRIVSFNALPPEIEALPASSDNKMEDYKFLNKYAMVFNLWSELRHIPGIIIRIDMFEAGRLSFIKAWQAGYRNILFGNNLRRFDKRGRFEAGLRFVLSGLSDSYKVYHFPFLENSDQNIEKWFDSASPDSCLIGMIEDKSQDSIKKRMQKPNSPACIAVKPFQKNSAFFSGIDQSSYRLGQRMIENVLAQPLANRHLLMQYTNLQTIAPVWHDGETLPQRECKQWNLIEDDAFDAEAHHRFECLGGKHRFPLECSPPHNLPCGGIQVALPPVGECIFHGVPFRIEGAGKVIRYCGVGDPDLHRRSDHTPLPSAVVEIPVERKARSLYFLHTATQVGDRVPVARYRFHFRKKGPVEVPVLPFARNVEQQDTYVTQCSDVNIQDWFYESGRFANASTKPVCLVNSNDSEYPVGYVYVWRWENPFPRSEITKIELLAEPGQPTIVLLFGVTAGVA